MDIFGQTSVQSILFFILYGVTGAVPLMAALYLSLRRGNAFAPDVTPPLRLRRWAASFFIMAALGHVWWLPFLTLGSILMFNPSQQILLVAIAYVLLLYVIFTVYMVFAVRRYGRWLNDNYADLENKKVWLSQLETLPQLPTQAPQPSASPVTIDLAHIGQLLEERCVATRLYQQHDLTLQQLALTIGTNRSYLSQYFSRQGITYNIYINNLRVNHFISLCQKAVAAGQPVVAQQLASESGYRSYSTFSLAFKQRTGQTVTAWIHDRVSKS